METPASQTSSMRDARIAGTGDAAAMMLSGTSLSGPRADSPSSGIMLFTARRSSSDGLTDFSSKHSQKLASHFDLHCSLPMEEQREEPHLDPKWLRFLKTHDSQKKRDFSKRISVSLVKV